MNFVALDFETANEGRASACSIGMVRVRDGVIVDKFYSLIRPEPNRFSHWNVRIHGITEWDVADAPTFKDLWPQIEAFIGSDPLVAHNASFDIGVLNSCLQQWGLPAFQTAYLCTVKAAKKIFPELPNHKLNTVSGAIGFSFCHHNALEDAEACARILIAASKRAKTTKLEAFCRESGCGMKHL